jgi:hypothetical protein
MKIGKAICQIALHFQDRTMFSQKQWRYLVGVCLATVIVAVTIWSLSKPATAQLGNSAIPVRCVPDATDEVIPPGGAAFFHCVAADGTMFDDGGQAVPAGHYLLVTDVVITPVRLTTVDIANEVALRDVAPDFEVTAELRLELFRSETLSVNYTTPFLVLDSGHRLSGEFASTDNWLGISVYVSGLLVTNVTYLPGVMNH